jgi:hypothetical protein
MRVETSPAPARTVLIGLVAREKCRSRPGGMISRILKVFDIAGFRDVDIDFLAI